MGVNVYKKNDSPDTTSISSYQPSKQDTIALDDDFLIKEIDQNIDNELKQLPGSEQYREINWLGSSFSGADIKVVAHLYDDPSTINEKEILTRERDLAQSIADGADTLTTGGLAQLATSIDSDQTYTFRKEMFINAAGLGNPDEVSQAAGNFLVSSIMNSSDFTTYIGLAKAKQRAQDIFQAYTAIRLDLDDRLQALSEIKQQAYQTVILASLQTISVQSHREKSPVRALGMINVKGWARGSRTIAGSMIFTVFNEHSLLQLIRSMGNSKTYQDKTISSLLPDQLPPIDLTVVFANEYGSLSSLRLFGVEFINDGTTYSIEDLLTENVINFVCRDADVLTSNGNVRLSRLQAQGALTVEGNETTGSDLRFSNSEYDKYLDTLKVRRGLIHR